MTTVGRRAGGVAGRLLPVDVTVAHTLSVEGPQSVLSQIAVVRVDGTIAGDTPGRECPHDELAIGDRRLACLWMAAVLNR